MHHSVAFWHFSRGWYPFEVTLGFFFGLVWLVPGLFFVSISVNDYALPLQAGVEASGFAPQRRERTSLMSSLLGRAKSALPPLPTAARRGSHAE